jgi:hypothetical protein
VWKVSPEGSVSTIAGNLKERRLFEFFFGDWHNLMALWLDAEENVYIAVMGGRMVKRVSKEGGGRSGSAFQRTWSPSGGLIAPNGDLWLLEYAMPLSARVRRIGRDGVEKIY